MLPSDDLLLAFELLVDRFQSVPESDREMLQAKLLLLCVHHLPSLTVLNELVEEIGRQNQPIRAAARATTDA